MNQKTKELNQLLRKMSKDELAEALSLIQAEQRARGNASPPVRQPWDRKIQTR